MARVTREDYIHTRLITQPVVIAHIQLTYHYSNGASNDSKRGTGTFMDITSNSDL